MAVDTGQEIQVIPQPVTENRGNGWRDSIKDFFGRFTNTESREGTDPRAAEFAKREDKISSVLHSIDRKIKDKRGSTFLGNKTHLILERYDDRIGVTAPGNFNEESRLPGLGSGTIRMDLGHDLDLSPSYASGQKPEHVLKVWLHMDEQTRAKVDLGDKTDGSYLSTMYYFNRDGKYGKLTMLPLEVEDPREVMVTEMSGGKPFAKYVQSVMTEEDFQLVDKSLSFLETDLKKVQTGVKPQ